MQTMHKQRGITLWGFVFVTAVFVIAAMVAVKLYPFYSENMGVMRTLNQVKEVGGLAKMTPAQVELEILKRLYYNDVRDINQENIRQHMQIERSSAGPKVVVDYSREAKFIKNIYLMVKFEQEVSLVGATGTEE